MTDMERMPFAGVIDADGHILEPPDLWERYLEPKYRERAIRIKTDERGLEYLELDGKKSKLSAHGALGFLGGMGKTAQETIPSPERTYLRGAPFGSMDAKERLQLLDQEGMDKAILYPTLGILWEAEVEDPDISAAYCRAYNRWILDFCADTGGRLLPIAHLSLGDVNEAVRELERTVKAGAIGAFVAPFTITKKPHGHPDHDPLWAKAQELNVPIAIHPTLEPVATSLHLRFTGMGHKTGWYYNVLAGVGTQMAFTTFFQYGVFDRFPNFKLVVLESGAGWVGFWIDRMDAFYKVPVGASCKLKELPSAYLRKQCWISADPDERALTRLIDYIGADRLMWATDFPHPDHGGHYVRELKEMLAPLPLSVQKQIAGENVKQLYKI
jgi:predicted TIM-barrel fold metal-dependent hydrolase